MGAIIYITYLLIRKYLPRRILWLLGLGLTHLKWCGSGRGLGTTKASSHPQFAVLPADGVRDGERHVEQRFGSRPIQHSEPTSRPNGAKRAYFLGRG